LIIYPYGIREVGDAIRPEQHDLSVLHDRDLGPGDTALQHFPLHDPVDPGGRGRRRGLRMGGDGRRLGLRPGGVRRRRGLRLLGGRRRRGLRPGGRGLKEGRDQYDGRDRLKKVRSADHIEEFFEKLFVYLLKTI
jgi:hypothetical protein